MSSVIVIELCMIVSVRMMILFMSVCRRCIILLFPQLMF